MYKLFIKKTKDSKLFLKEVLNKYHLNVNDIFYNEYGKPYLKGNSIYFNTSSSGEYSVIAICDVEVGIDIQKITYKKRVVDKVCNEEEKKSIKTPEDFTKMWVKKESYAKWLGKGFSAGFKSIDTKNNKYYLKKYKDYYICIYFEKH